MRSRGFNIIELMITVAIAGILALVGIPQMTQQVENARVRSVTNDLTTAVSLARSEAVRQGVNARVQAITVDGKAAYTNGWCVVLAGSNCDATNTLRQYDPPGNLALDPDAGTFVEFDRLGARVVDNNHTSSLHLEPASCAKDQNRARQVQITASGRPNVTRVICL